MKTLVDDVVERMPLETRAHILAEGRADHSFWPYITRIARQPDGAKAIDDEMKRAAINELDPNRHKEMRGRWHLLRYKIRYIKSQVAQNARPGFMGHPPPPIIHGIEGLAEGIPGMVTSLDQPTASTTAASSSGGTDIWGTIGKVLSSAATAAGSIYSTKIATGAQQDIAKIQAQAAQGIALTQQQQQQLAAARAAAASGTGGGLSTAMYILLGLLGLGGLVFLSSVISRRH